MLFKQTSVSYEVRDYIKTISDQKYLDTSDFRCFVEYLKKKLYELFLNFRGVKMFGHICFSDDFVT